MTVSLKIKAGSHREDCERLEAYMGLRQGQIMNLKKLKKT